MAIGDEEIDRVLQQARTLSDQLWALATKYQDQNQSATDHPASDDSDPARPNLDRQTLERLFRTLQPQGLIDKLRQHGIIEVADTLNDQWKNTAKLFDRSSSSDAVGDQTGDAIASSDAVSIALSNFSMKDWTRDDYIDELKGIDNAGLLDYVNESTLETLSDEEFHRLYERVSDYSFQRARAWQGDYSKREMAKSRIKKLIWLMYQAGDSAAMITKTMGESLDSVQRTLMWEMNDAGVPDSTIVTSLGVTIEDIDRVVWTRQRANVADSSDDPYGDEAHTDDEDDDEPIEADPIDELFQLGHVFYNLGDLPDALVCYEKAAVAGHVEAMSMLGALLAADCDPPNLSAARAWYEKAANAGDVVAMFNLGVLFESLTEPPNLAAARSWYEKAADRGHTGAMFNLAIVFKHVDPPDLVAARDWYEKAANAGSKNAMIGLGCLLAEQWEPRDLAGAQTWFERAANAGDTNAMLNLGWLFATQIDPPDVRSAESWYEKAAERGNTNAMYELAMLLAKSDPSESSVVRHWLEKAAERGHTDAVAELERLET